MCVMITKLPHVNMPLSHFCIVFNVVLIDFLLPRFSEMKKVKSLKTSWTQKMEDRAAKKALKLRERELKEARAKELEVVHFSNISVKSICLILL